MPRGHAPPQIAVAPVVVGDQRLLEPLQPVLVGGGGPAGRRSRGRATSSSPTSARSRRRPSRASRPARRCWRAGPATPSCGPWCSGHLAADEAHLLRQVGPGAGGVEGELVANRAAEQVVDRLLPHPAEQVPEREVDGADHVEDEPLAAVEERGPAHLVPDLLDVGDQRALDEAGQVPLDDPGAGLARRSSRRTRSCRRRPPPRPPGCRARSSPKLRRLSSVARDSATSGSRCGRRSSGNPRWSW